MMWRRTRRVPRPGMHCVIRGVATLEFMSAATLVLIPLVMAIFELAQLTVARHALEFTASEIARAQGAGDVDDPAAAPSETRLRLAAAVALSPLFPTFDAMTESDAGVARDRASAWPTPGYRVAVAQTSRADLFAVRVTDVTDAAYVDRMRSERIEILYCRETFFPPIDRMIVNLLWLSERDAFALACLARNRVPLRASATAVRAAFATMP